MLLVLVTGLPGTGKSTTADAAGRALGAPVLGHDWAMSGLRPYPEVQAALDRMGWRGHREVGWSILWALARSQLRLGSSVVLDGVARQPQVAGTRRLATEEGTGSVVVMTRCVDADVHRSRIEGRRRGIPDWYELEWANVVRARESWQEPEGVDLVLEASDDPEHNERLLVALLLSRGARPKEGGPEGGGEQRR
ncbi:MAG TPA: AAA family ATPase [Acidimicrobiales bacterium]|nr:AAA family ATPase [Acidimicrobiales bacterium]